MSPDYFALLELPRQPWLDEEAVRAQFQRFGATAHPDGGGGDGARFVALNEAWQTLRSPTARLRHYLELAHPELLHSAGGMAGANADLFMQIAEAQQQANSFATRLATTRSPLSRALLETERVALQARLEGLASQVDQQTEEIHKQLRASTADPSQLASALHQLVFLEKWSKQLRERLLGLA